MSERNLILTLFGSDLSRLEPYLKQIQLRTGQLLQAQGAPIEHIYFPEGGLYSKLCGFQDGSRVEVALVGRYACIGVEAVLGLGVGLTNVVVRLDALARCMPVEVFIEAADQCPAISRAARQYLSGHYETLLRVGSCNARHSAEQRLCRWLLLATEGFDSNLLPFSQDVLGEAIGVRRTSVNPILQSLRSAGLVGLGRSKVVVLDRARLAARACECFEEMRQVKVGLLTLSPKPFASVLPQPFGSF